MAKHASSSPHRAPKARDLARDAAPEVGSHHCGATVDLLTIGADGYCYSCADNAAGHSQYVPAAAQEQRTAPLPERLRLLFAQRALHRSATHAGLFMRHECPHLTDQRVAYIQRVWKLGHQRQLLIDSNCARGLPTEMAPINDLKSSGQFATWKRRAGECANRSTYLCLHCGCLLCGIGAADGHESKGHMHQHALETGHMCVIGLRSLTPYCFGCDRVIGVGGTSEDAGRAAALRRVFTQCRAIYHHRAEETPWRFLDHHPPQ
jgi:hypothetical protein